VDAFAGEVIGSVADVLAAGAAIIALIPRRPDRKEVPVWPNRIPDRQVTYRGAGR
jgi:hypothetical protein